MCDCRRTDVHLRGSKKIKINVIPETAKIYIDGQLVGEGTYQVKFEKGVDFYVVKAEAPGYITRTYRLLKSNPKTQCFTFSRRMMLSILQSAARTATTLQTDGLK